MKMESKPTQNKNSLFRAVVRDKVFYLMLLPAILYTLIMNYIPMLGIAMAFKDYNFIQGFWKSPWVGMKNITDIFTVPSMQEAIMNTITLNGLSLIICFIAPIIFALLLNEIKGSAFKRIIQTVSYLPHFLSWVAVISIAYNLFGSYGIINDMREALGLQRVMFMAQEKFFLPNYLFLSVWKSIGWDSIIYLAAISGIDQQLYEAAEIDGANEFQQAWHITFKSIIPTIIILFILKIGQLFGSNFELVYNLQNAFVNKEVISTVVYKSGIQQGNYSMSTAISLVQGVIALALTMITNQISKKVSSISMW